MTTPSERERAEWIENWVELDNAVNNRPEGWRPGWPSFGSIGYQEVAKMLEAARREERKRCAEKLAEAARRIADFDAEELPEDAPEFSREQRIADLERILTETLGGKL